MTATESAQLRRALELLESGRAGDARDTLREILADAPPPDPEQQPERGAA